ncbi:cell division cycle-associated protein 2 isoform X3 [Dicentrarchus labrax]|uniref:cell division cycle-associated protein 2 isoform X3 n=1 Tax=Dicentrarchus labrax TaxID=13489 RepID=UPI0021F5E214|nr:cell division cycle-associated protein 2 isoform X3 [Dicentrarchus labrax]
MYKVATAVEMNSGVTEGDQKEKMVSPLEEDSPPVLNDTSAPLNFTEITPCQFGISVQSFTPASLSNRKDKSRLAQIKARRRSSIGVRGSPETNSLIRFMAQQKMKTPPTFQTPELVRSSPFLPRVASTLRQKMASFQNLMDVEESEVCDPMPKQDSNTGGCIKTRDYLSDGNSHDGEKENHPLLMTPTASKRRRVGPLESCKLEIREASAPIPHFSLEELEGDEPVAQVVTRRPLPSSETVEEACAVLKTPPFHVDFELQACSPTDNQQDGGFELQSSCQPPPGDPAAASPARPASSFRIPSLPSQLEMRPIEDDDSTGKSTVKNKKKSVHFGGLLSPEFFDKNLPPSTPLQKGGTPARAPTPGGSLQLRSVLKTPQRSESQTPQAQPDLSSPTVFGASPTLAMPRNRRMRSVGEDSGEKDGKFFFPSVEESDSPVTNDTVCTWDTQPLNLNTAFHEESLSQILTESGTKPSSTSQMDAMNEMMSLLEQEKQSEATVEAVAQCRNRRKKQPGPELESNSEIPARSSSRKRKPEQSEPVKRSTRSAAKSASGKMKKTSTATRRWNRDVDRSLYGSRAYASKNPTLSPITERLSFISQSPAAQQTPSVSCTAPNHETQLNPEMTNDNQVPGDLTVTNGLENPSENSITSPNSSKESSTGKGRRLSGPRVRGKGHKKRKVSVADGILLGEETLDQTGGTTEDRCEDQTTKNVEASRETPLTHTVPEQGGVDTELIAETSADTHCTGFSGKLECNGSLDAPLSDCSPSGEESNNTWSLPSEPAQRKVKRGRRSSVSSSVLQEQGYQAEEHQACHEAEEKEQGDQAAIQQENGIGSSSDSQEEGAVASLDLAPWQADFNFEDVFKPVATRGQRSVRRSLRNQSNTEHSSSNSAGLAWLPRTSPDISKEARRRTRGRRLSAAPPVTPLLLEETQDNAS